MGENRSFIRRARRVAIIAAAYAWFWKPGRASSASGDRERWLNLRGSFICAEPDCVIVFDRSPGRRCPRCRSRRIHPFDGVTKYHCTACYQLFGVAKSGVCPSCGSEQIVFLESFLRPAERARWLRTIGSLNGSGRRELPLPSQRG